MVDAAGDAVVQGARAVGDTSGAAPGAEQGWEDAVAAVLQSIAQKQDQPANVGLSSPSHLIEARRPHPCGRRCRRPHSALTLTPRNGLAYYHR